jgi:hypothetical protein
MEKQLARIVNKGLVDEPENVVLQVKDTLEMFEFSQIKYVDEAGSIRNVTLIDDTLDQPEILHILNSLMHEVYISFDESKNVTVYF